MTLALVAGGVSAALVALAALWWRSAPTRVRCPRCGEGTSSIAAPASPELPERAVVRRFCTGCGWEGLGKAGPGWKPGHPAAHDSGFHWGDERHPPDFGFRWGADEGPVEEGAPPPDHPSGFRFSQEEEPEPRGWAFRWGGEGGDPRAGAPEAGADPEAGGDESGVDADRTRRGFRWGGSERREERGGFRWKGDGPE